MVSVSFASPACWAREPTYSTPTTASSARIPIQTIARSTGERRLAVVVAAGAAPSGVLLVDTFASPLARRGTGRGPLVNGALLRSESGRPFEARSLHF